MAQITYTIPDNKLDEFKNAFLKYRSVPLDEYGEPIMSENAWIKEWGKQQFLQAYRNGKQLLAEDNMVLESNIIE